MSARSRSASNAGVEEIPPPELISPLTVCFNNTLNGSDNSGEFEATFLEIVEHIVGGEKKSTYFCNVLRAIGYTEENAKISLILANILWFAGTQVNQATEIDKWNNLCATVKDYGNSGLVDTSILRQTLEFNLLHGAQLTKEDPVLLNKKLVKVRTALYFKQQKYNLLREEPEGFSKLAVVLNSMPEYPQDCSAYVKNVCSLIGTFDLCPNRVLDVTLDAFETRPHNLNFVTLLKKFKRDNIAHMLGFKFCFYQEEYERESAAAAASADGKTTAPAAAAGVEKKGGVVSLANTAGTSKNREIPGAKTVVEDSSKTKGAPPASAAAIPSSDTVPPLQRPQAAPASLYALAATLIMSDMVQIADLVPYLAPTAEATKCITAEIEKACRKQVTSYGVISLNAAANAAAATAAAAVPVTPAVPRDVGSAAVSQEVTSATATGREARSAAPVTRGGSGSSASAGGGKPPPPSGPPPVVGQYSSTVATSVAGSSAGSVDGKEDLLIGSPEFDEQLSLFYEEEAFHRPNLLYAEGNQLIGLATALINLRGWSQALVILSYLESSGVVEAVRYSVHLRQAIIDLALYAIDDVYQSISVQKLHLSARNTSFGRFQQGNKGSIFHPPVFPQPQLQPITSLQTFPVDLLPLLDALSYHLGESNVLFTRLCRLSAAWIKTASEQAQVDNVESGGVPLSEVLEPVITLFTTNLLPSLSVCADSNAYLAAQLWSPVSLLPFDIRFRVYDAWKGAGLGKDGLNSKPSSVALAETKALHSTKAVLKRLAKENVKSIGRQLCKITPMNPIVVFNYVLSTIEVFDNLIPYMVDALKYSTELARDCMAYCLVTQLKKENSGKLKKGDTHYSSWFSALSKFIAMFYCRYPTTELKGLFHYLLSVLSEGDSLDLLVLKELLVIMGGCETLLEVSAIQLEGLAGGRVLRQEMMGVTTNMIASSGISVNNNKKATIALREELMTSKTALPLLLFIAQIRGAILYDTPSSETQLKLISHLFDITQDVLMQFTDFLVAGAKSVEHIALLMPSLDTLVKEVGLAVPIAFQLVRPIVRNALSFALQQQTAQIDSSSTTLSSMPAYLQPWDPFSSSMLSNVQAYVPATVWNSLTPQLFLLFWSLSQYDIQTPINRYNLEIKRVKDRYTDLDNKKYSSMMSNPLTGAPYTSSEISKLNRQREADMARLMTSMTALNEEMSKQLAHVEVIKSLIAAQKDSYFLQQPVEPLSEEVVMEVVEAKEEESSAVMVVEATAAEATSESTEMAVDDAATSTSAAALDATTAAVAVVETDEVNEDGEMTLEDGGSASILKDDEEFAEDENGDVIIVKKKGGASSATAAVPAKAPIVLLPVDKSTVNVVATNVMQELVYNRVLMSPIDAVYCTQFLLLLHDNETPHFSLLHCYDKMVKTIAPLIFCTTEVEASFIGYALSDMLATVNRWVSNKGLFRTEFQGKLGSRYSVDRLLPSDLVAKLKVKADAAAAAAEKEGQVVDEGVTHEMFVELTKVWHTKLFTVIMSTLAAKEYMFIRCALILLAKVSNLFPIRAVEGRKILLLVEQLSVTEKERVDLQLMARSLTTMLKKTVWIDEKPAAKKEKKVVKNMSEIDLLNSSAATAANKRDTAAPNGRDRDARDSRGADATANTNIREDASGKWSRGDNLQQSSSSSNLHGKDSRDYGRSSEGVREGRDGQRDGRDAGRDTSGRDATTRDTRDGTANSRASRTGTAPVSAGQSERDRVVPAADRNAKPSAPSGQSDREARDARSARNADQATNKDSTHKDAKVSKESKDSSSKDKEKVGAVAAAPLSGVKRKMPPESSGASDGKHNEGAAATGASSMASASKSQKVSNSSATAPRDSGRDGNNKDNAASRPPQQRSDSRERSDSRSRAPNTSSSNINPPTTATKRPHEQISKDSTGNSSGKVNGNGRVSRDARDSHSSGSGNQQNQQNQLLRRSDSRERVEAAAAPNNSAHLSREPRDNRTSSSNTPAASAATATETKTGKKVSAMPGKDHKEGKDAKEKGEDSKRQESVKDSTKDTGGKDTGNKDISKDTSNKDGGKDREAKSSSDKEKTNESTDKGSSKKTNNDVSSKMDAGSSSASTGATAFAADLQRESDAKNAARQSRFGKPTPAGSAVESAKPVVSAMLSKLNSSIGSGEATSSPRGSDRADTSTPRTNGNHSNISAKVSTGGAAEKTPTTASATSSSRDTDGKSDSRKPAASSTNTATTTTPSPAAGKIVEVKKVSTAKKAATPTKEAASATADRSDNKSDSVTVAVPTAISSATNGDNYSVSSAGGPKTKRPRSDSRSDAPPPAAAVTEKAAEKASGSDKSAVDVLAPPVTSFGKTNKPRPVSNDAVVRAVSEPIPSSAPSSEAPSAAEPTVMTEAERRRKERLNGAGAKKPKVETAPANPPNPFTGTAPPPPASEPPRDNRGFSGPQSQGQPRHSNSAPGGNYRNKQHQQQPQSYAPPVQMVPSSQFIPQFQMGPPAVYQTQQSALVQLNQQPQRGNTRPPPPPGPSSYQQPHPQQGGYHHDGGYQQQQGGQYRGGNNNQRRPYK